MRPDLEIVPRLPDTLRAKAGTLIWDAFGTKMRPIVRVPWVRPWLGFGAYQEMSLPLEPPPYPPGYSRE